MRVDVCVCVYVCVWLCVYVCVCVCVCVYVCVWLCVYVCVLEVLYICQPFLELCVQNENVLFLRLHGASPHECVSSTM